MRTMCTKTAANRRSSGLSGTLVEPRIRVLRLLALASFVGLLAVWVLYPLVIAALSMLASRRRRALADAGGDEPMVSVIIATREDAETTRRRIADCLATSYDPAKLEVVVGIDAASRNDVAALRATLESGANVTVVIGDEPGGKSATLNAAVRASRGEILVFADCHQRFERDAIRELVLALRAPRVGAVSGLLDIPRRSERRSLAERYWLFERWLRRREASVHSCAGVSGAIWAMRRSIWTPLPAHLILDDLYAPMRIILGGYRVAFAQSARAIELRRHDATQEYRRKVRTLTGVIQVCAWQPRLLNPLANPIWLQFTFHKLLRFLTPYWLVAIGCWAAVTAAQLLGAGVWLAAVAAAAALAATHFAKPNVVRGVKETLVSGALLQTATIIGAVNGFRGRWNVWHN